MGFWVAAFTTCLTIYASQMLMRFSCSRGAHINSGIATPIVAIARPAKTPSGDLRKLETAWNLLNLKLGPPERQLRIAVFVKKWPIGGAPGGLERHALTLHEALAGRGHDVHVFTMVPGLNATSHSVRKNNTVSLYSFDTATAMASNGPTYNQTAAWAHFLTLNASKPFDILHTESVALHHSNAQSLSNLVASWHGIAFETIHSDIVRDLIRPPNASRSPDLQRTLTERLFIVSDEIRFFSHYQHHVAISDYVGEVLRTVYEIPTENVHVILNGVDNSKFSPAPIKGLRLQLSADVDATSALVLGVAGRLVKDKGHPLLVEALPEFLSSSNRTSKCPVYVLVAGDGPWASRYRELSPHCVKVLGPMGPSEMANFYNAIDVFVNPTLRAQGLDLTLLEAMMCGKPLLATRFSSITRSVVVDGSVGYTFSPNVASLAAALRQVVGDGKEVLAAKGRGAYRTATQIFTAAKMSLAYERLFLCIADPHYCQYPLQ